MTLYANFVEKLAYRELCPIRPPEKSKTAIAPILVPEQPGGGLPSHRTPHILVTLHNRVTKM